MALKGTMSYSISSGLNMKFFFEGFSAAVGEECRELGHVEQETHTSTYHK